MATIRHVTSSWDLENFRPMDFCSTECVQKLRASSSTRRSTTMSIGTHLWILPWVGRILFWPSRHTCFRVFSTLHPSRHITYVSKVVSSKQVLRLEHCLQLSYFCFVLRAQSVVFALTWPHQQHMTKHASHKVYSSLLLSMREICELFLCLTRQSFTV